MCFWFEKNLQCKLKIKINAIKKTILIITFRCNDQTIDFRKSEMKKQIENVVFMIVIDQIIRFFRRENLVIRNKFIFFEIVIFKSNICRIKQVYSIFVIFLKFETMSNQILINRDFHFDKQDMKKKRHIDNQFINL